MAHRMLIGCFIVILSLIVVAECFGIISQNANSHCYVFCFVNFMYYFFVSVTESAHLSGIFGSCSLFPLVFVHVASSL